MKIRVRNYQTVEDISFEVKGFTVIVGKSNTGKTALLRAIIGSIYNDPVIGKVRWGAKETIVKVEYKDTTWEWTKGDKPPKYKITTPTVNEEYSSLGRKVPHEISDAGFKEWKVDDVKTRPQVAAWHEPIFLLDKTGKVVTELITTVTRLDVVNMAIRKCSSKLRKMRSRLKVREEDLLKAEKRGREFDVMDDIDMVALEAARDGYTDTQVQIGIVGEYIIRHENLSQRLENFGVMDSLVVPEPIATDNYRDVERLASWEKKVDALNTILEGSKILDDVVVPAADLQEDLTALEALGGQLRLLDKYQGESEALKVLDDVSIPEVDLQGKVDALGQVDGFLIRLIKVAKELKTTKSDLEENDLAIVADVQHLEALRGSIDECPVCARVE